MKIVKSRQEDIAKIEELFISSESKIVREFLAKVKQQKSDDKISQVREYLELGRPDLAIELLEDDSSWLLLFFNIWLLASALQVSFISQSILEARKKYYPFAVIMESLGFDPTDLNNAAQVKNIATIVLENLKQRRLEAMQYIINLSTAEGLSPAATALRLQKFSGLTVKQIEASLTYERLLRQGSKTALDRALRDPNFDRLVLSGKTLTEKQIQKMVDAYIRKNLVYRAQELARAISADLINTGMEEAAKQMAVTAGIPVDDLAKQWISMRDSKVRFTHKQHVGLDGKIVGINEYFVSPSGARLFHPRDGSAPISETAGCRCRMFITYKPKL